MRVAVTGSSGLIGTAVCAALAGEGHELVRLVRRAPSAPTRRSGTSRPARSTRRASRTSARSSTSRARTSASAGRGDPPPGVGLTGRRDAADRRDGRPAPEQARPRVRLRGRVLRRPTATRSSTRPRGGARASSPSSSRRGRLRRSRPAPPGCGRCTCGRGSCSRAAAERSSGCSSPSSSARRPDRERPPVVELGLARGRRGRLPLRARASARGARQRDGAGRRHEQGVLEGARSSVAPPGPLPAAGARGEGGLRPDGRGDAARRASASRRRSSRRRGSCSRTPTSTPASRARSRLASRYARDVNESTTSSSSAQAWPASPAPVRSSRPAGAPLVLERSDAIGGRVRTDVVDGFQLDHGFQVLPTAYPEARAALDFERLELGQFERGAIIRADGRFRRLADPRHAPVRSLRALAGGVVCVRDGAAVLRLLRGGGDETTTPRRCARRRLARDGRDDSSRRSCAASSSRSGCRPRAGSSTSSSGRSRTARRRCRAGHGGNRGPARGGLDIRTGTARRDRRARTPSRSSPGEQLRADAVVVATAGIVDEPAHGWNGVTCVYYDAPATPIPGPWLVLNGEGGPMNNLCVPSEVARRAMRPPGAHSSRSRSSAPASPTSTRSSASCAVGSARAVADWRHLRTYRIPRALPAYPVGGFAAQPVRLAAGLYACGDHREHPSLNGALASGRRAGGGRARGRASRAVPLGRCDLRATLSGASRRIASARRRRLIR